MVADLLLLEAYPHIHTLGVALRFAKLPQGKDAAAVEEAEVAYVFEHVEAGGTVEEAVVEAAQTAAQPTLARNVSPRIDVLCSLFPEAKHVGDEGGRMLEVGVEDDDAVARSVVKARQHSILLAKIAREADEGHPRVLATQLPHDAQRLVAAAVVDEQHLPLVLHLAVHDLTQGCMEGGERRLLVVAGDEQGDFLHFFLISYVLETDSRWLSWGFETQQKLYGRVVFETYRDFIAGAREIS